MAGKQIKFTVPDATIAYLRWLAKNILFEDDENGAARHLMMKQLEETRRNNRSSEPTADEIERLMPPDKDGAKTR
jgi:hypothetical protein